MRMKSSIACMVFDRLHGNGNARGQPNRQFWSSSKGRFSTYCVASPPLRKPALAHLSRELSADALLLLVCVASRWQVLLSVTKVVLHRTKVACTTPGYELATLRDLVYLRRARGDAHNHAPAPGFEAKADLPPFIARRSPTLERAGSRGSSGGYSSIPIPGSRETDVHGRTAGVCRRERASCSVTTQMRHRRQSVQISGCST